MYTITPPTPQPSTAAATPAAAKAYVRLNELFIRWIDYIDVRPESAETYTRAVRQFLRWLQGHGSANLRREDILAYMKHLETTRKPATAQLYVAALRRFFGWLEMEGAYKNIAEHVKSTPIERGHKRDHLTPDQLKNVLGKIERDSERGKRDYAMLSLMATAGLRITEVCQAGVKDIRTVGGSVRIYLQSKGKDGKADFINLPPQVDLAVREYLSARRHLLGGSAPLFTGLSNNSCGARLTTRAVCGIVKDRLRAAGYDCDRLTAHSLRHSAVALALLGGQSLQDVQQFARHMSISTTVVYAHRVDRADNRCAETVAGAIF